MKTSDFVCPKCKELKPASDYWGGYCKPCRQKYNRDWFLQDKYRITADEFDTLLAQQSGGCALCGDVNLSGKNLFVDHDHTTGEVRGLLCHNCNYVIGYARDNIDILEKAIKYLLIGRNHG
jgi:hypothetical protein